MKAICKCGDLIVYILPNVSTCFDFSASVTVSFTRATRTAIEILHITKIFDISLQEYIYLAVK